MFKVTTGYFPEFVLRMRLVIVKLWYLDGVTRINLDFIKVLIIDIKQLLKDITLCLHLPTRRHLNTKKSEP